MINEYHDNEFLYNRDTYSTDKFKIPMNDFS